MRITLILPTCYDEHGRLVKFRKATVPPLALLHLAALTPPEHEVRIVHELVQDVPFNEPLVIISLAWK